MFSRKKKLLVFIAIISLVIQMTFTSPMIAQAAGTDRVSGEDRYKTAVAVSQQGWETAEYAVLARGDNFADALCAGPLAYKYGGPILLTKPDGLNSDTLAELKRLEVKHLFITGGLGAVSQSVEDTLKDNGFTTLERIYGNDRYETSVKIAEKLGTSSEAVLATGSDFPDALSISGIAAKSGMPILLTASDNLPESVAGYLTANTIIRTYVVGGTGVISTEVENMIPAPLRLAGTDRYETNTVIMTQFAGELDFERIYIAVGNGFADALTGAVLAAKTSSPLVLTAATLPSVTGEYLETKLKLSTKVVGLGGKKAVASTVLTGIMAGKENIPVEERYSIAGTYGPDTGTKTIQGSAIISAADVTLRNIVIEGDLLLGVSIGDGNVTLSGVTVKGKTIVNGGGPNSVIMYNFNGQTVVVDVPDGASVRLVAQGSTSVGDVSMEGSGQLEESELTGDGFRNVEIPAGAEVMLSGTFDQVDVKAGGANVNVTSGSINTMNIFGTAAGSNINLDSGSSVNNLNANAPSNVTGQGRITNANINTDNVTIEQEPDNTTVAEGVTNSTVGGESIEGDGAATETETETSSGSSGSSSSSGSGDSGDSTVNVSGITVNASTMTLTAGGATGTLTETVAPENATNKTVTWSSSDESVATVADGVVTPVAAGTTTITVTTADGGFTATAVVTVIETDAEFTPGEGGAITFTPFTAEENRIGGLYIEKNHDYYFNIYEGSPIYNHYVELKFLPAHEFGATGYKLQYSEDSGDTWVDYPSGTAISETQDNCSVLDPSTTTMYRLEVVGGDKAGYTSNEVTAEILTIQTKFTGGSLGESVDISGVMYPWVGRGLEAGFTAEVSDYPDTDTVYTNEHMTYQWYRVNPLSYEMTAIPGATDLTYITTADDMGYNLLIRATGDGENIDGFCQIMADGAVAQNKSYVSDITGTGFTLNLYKTVPELTASDLILTDYNGDYVTINGVTQGENAAIYNISASLDPANGPFILESNILENSSDFWRIASADEGFSVVQIPYSVDRYGITVADVVGGTATAGTTPNIQAAAGETVTVSISSIEDGKRFKSITVTDADSGVIDTTEVTAGEEYTFTMPARGVTVTVEIEVDEVLSAKTAIESAATDGAFDNVEIGDNVLDIAQGIADDSVTGVTVRIADVEMFDPPVINEQGDALKSGTAQVTFEVEKGEALEEVNPIDVTVFPSSATEVTASGNHYVVNTSEEYYDGGWNSITANETVITTDTIVGDEGYHSGLLLNLSKPVYAEWAVFSSDQTPSDVAGFNGNDSKAVDDKLAVGDVLAVLAEDGSTLRVYAIDVKSPATVENAVLTDSTTITLTMSEALTGGSYTGANGFLLSTSIPDVEVTSVSVDGTTVTLVVNKDISGSTSVPPITLYYDRQSATVPLTNANGDVASFLEGIEVVIP